MYTKEFFKNLEKELIEKNISDKLFIQVNVSNNNAIRLKITDYNKYWVWLIDCFSEILENIGVKNNIYIIDENDIKNYEELILNNQPL